MTSLQHHFAAEQRLRRHIMRRVWYVYSLSLILSPALVLGVLFGASAIAFWQLVSITSIVQNVLATDLGRVPTYIWQSLWQAETVSLVAFCILVGVGVVAAVRALTIVRASLSSLRYVRI